MSFAAYITVEECAKDLGLGITAERLLELAQGGFLPHSIVDGRLYVKRGLVEKWIKEHLMQTCDGAAVPRVVSVYTPTEPPIVIPHALAPMANILSMMPLIEIPPCIYFLCRGNKVVYVGQTVCLAGRVAAHRQSGKLFDYVLHIVVPSTMLDVVEGALIRAIKPELSRGAPSSADKDEEALRSLGWQITAPVAPEGTVVHGSAPSGTA